MAGTGEKVSSLRLNRFESKRLVWALLLSLAAHFLVWGGYELGKATGLWQRLHLAERLHLAPKKSPPPVQPVEPTMFLEVDPDQVSPDAPKDAKYYSAQNSRAAQASASTENSSQPKLDGKQTDIAKVRNVPRTPVTKPQPAPEPPAPKKEPQPAQPKPTEQPGDLKLAKLDPTPEKKPAPERPRTLNEARAQQQTLQPSIQMQQEGGARTRLVPAFDSKATAFGAYDAKIVEAISQRWYDLLDSQRFAQDRSGKVTLQFHLNSNGTISDLVVLQNTVGDLLGYVCQSAITDPAPFEAWPSDMRKQIGANFRELTFTFYYY